MKNLPAIFLTLCTIQFFTACIYDPDRPTKNDITIINDTPDSLYYYIHDYMAGDKNTYNFAYDSIANHDTAINRYDIAYNINNQRILPHDTLHPSVIGSWKQLASRNDGLTIIFYKRNIQHLAEHDQLSDTNEFRRFDLTAKQLDSLKYVIELKK